MKIPLSIIAPIIIAVCAIGSYTLSNAPADLIFMVMFGIIGYLFKKLDYPLAPMVLAIVLGGRAESSFRQAMIGSQGDLSVFWSNGLVGSITALSMIMLFWPLISKVFGSLMARMRGGGLKPAE
jgi:putative tricarboxylic transport membrane protein